jgi:GTP:adenosylcobinamide-phosphate guanylyltransferase
MTNKQNDKQKKIQISAVGKESCRAVILAAGSGKRFFKSGGETFKQIMPYNGEPVLRRLIRQIESCSCFGGITVVLGENIECRVAIRRALDGLNVDYIVNKYSESDNNLLSFFVGTADIDQAVLLIEADCVVNVDALQGMIAGLTDNEIRWAHVGDIVDFKYGGLIEIDQFTEMPIGIAVLEEKEFFQFKSSGKRGFKMFGLTSFGKSALRSYREKISLLKDPYNKYFHQIAVEDSSEFYLNTYRVEDNCFSFNTVGEIK